ncbi:acyl-CoA dehydrogenase family protein [Azotobacter vinelandii]
MSRYEAPLEDLNFIFEHLLDNERLVALPGFEDLSTELIGAILEEAGRFASGVLAPLNATGDREGVRWSDGEVATPEGFKEAYRQYVESGWNNVAVEKEYGGQGLPYAVSMAIGEIMMAANKSLVMCPGLTLGAIESLCAAASPMAARLSAKGSAVPAIASWPERRRKARRVWPWGSMKCMTLASGVLTSG